MKSDLISESFNRKFGVILFVYDLMFGWSIMNVENYPKKAIEQRNIGTQIKTWTWVSANSLRATWPRRFSLNQSSLKFRTKFLVLNRSIQLHSLEGGLPSQAKCSPLPPPPLPIYTPRCRRHSESKVICSRIRRNDSARSRTERTDHNGTASPASWNRNNIILVWQQKS